MKMILGGEEGTALGRTALGWMGGNGPVFHEIGLLAITDTQFLRWGSARTLGAAIAGILTARSTLATFGVRSVHKRN